MLSHRPSSNVISLYSYSVKCIHLKLYLALKVKQALKGTFLRGFAFTFFLRLLLPENVHLQSTFRDVCFSVYGSDRVFMQFLPYRDSICFMCGESSLTVDLSSW